MTADVAGQLADLPADATHLAVSVGGNDALQHAGLLDQPIDNAAQLLGRLAQVRERFRQGYAAMLAAVLASRLPVVVCSIYDSNFELPQKQLADVALTTFNDSILRCAVDAGVPVVDLRRLFSERRDYANAIEPSAIGGRKLAQAIVRVTAEHDFGSRRTTLYA